MRKVTSKQPPNYLLQKVFMEGMGFDETADQADDSTVVIESALYTELKQKVVLLRLP